MRKKKIICSSCHRACISYLWMCRLATVRDFDHVICYIYQWQLRSQIVQLNVTAQEKCIAGRWNNRTSLVHVDLLVESIICWLARQDSSKACLNIAVLTDLIDHLVESLSNISINLGNCNIFFIFLINIFSWVKLLLEIYNNGLRSAISFADSTMGCEPLWVSRICSSPVYLHKFKLINPK